MHSRPRLAVALAALACVLLAAEAAGAQTTSKKRVIPPSRPAADLTLPATTTKTPVPAAPPPLRLGGLAGMSPVGDPAPACRAQCSKDRYVCHATNDPADCDSRWIPCLHACSSR